MPVIREYRCNDCGALFESMSQDPECPTCSGAEPERVFLTPPGIKSPQTAFKDETVKGLAADFGLSNMSNRDGQPVKGQRGPDLAHAKWNDGAASQWLGRAAGAPPSIVDGCGFASPSPQYVGKVRPA